MADKADQELFQIPKDIRDDMEKAKKRLEPLKRMLVDFESLGYDGTQMKADIARIEKQIALLEKYSKPVAVPRQIKQ